MSGSALRRRLDELEHQCGGVVPIAVYYASAGEPDLLVEVIEQRGVEWQHELHHGWNLDGPCSVEPCERCR